VVWWLIAAGVLVVAEILTTNLFFAMTPAVPRAPPSWRRSGVYSLPGGCLRGSTALFRRAPAAVTSHRRPSDRWQPGGAGPKCSVVSARDGRVKLGEIWSARVRRQSSFRRRVRPVIEIWRDRAGRRPRRI
jgi:membrane protein implicated in regulation of membrane protease activity